MKNCNPIQIMIPILGTITVIILLGIIPACYFLITYSYYKGTSNKGIYNMTDGCPLTMPNCNGFNSSGCYDPFYANCPVGGPVGIVVGLVITFLFWLCAAAFWTWLFGILHISRKNDVIDHANNEFPNISELNGDKKVELI